MPLNLHVVFFDYAYHIYIVDKTKCALFMCLVIRAYLDSQENVCSHVSVSTCIIPNQCQTGWVWRLCLLTFFNSSKSLGLQC